MQEAYLGCLLSLVRSVVTLSQGYIMESQKAGLPINGFGQVFSVVYLC